MSKQTERAWAAGFFDGEGTSGFFGQVHHRFGAQIHQNDREVLDRFLAAVGSGTVRGPYSQKKWHAGDSYTWQANGVVAVHYVMKQLWPYLGTLKRRQYKAAVLKWREYKKAHPGRAAMKCCKRGHAFTPSNTRISAAGSRCCRKCAVLATQRYQASVRERLSRLG